MTVVTSFPDSNEPRPFRVFLSSTSSDLVRHRKAAIEAIRRADMLPLELESDSAYPNVWVDAINQRIEQADVYVLILGPRYGSIAPVEYRAAQSRGIPILAFISPDDTALKPGESSHIDLEAATRAKFVQELRQRHLIQHYRSPDDLGNKVLVELSRLQFTALQQLGVISPLDMVTEESGEPMLPGPNVFLSYRRADTLATAGRLYDWLTTRFDEESVYWDIVSIPPAVHFERHVGEALDRSSVVFALIGHDWAGLRRDGTRRIDDIDDYVRWEIEGAFQRGVRVVPILVDGAEMPKPEDLPPSLRRLSYLQSLTLRNGADFKSDFARIVAAVTSPTEQAS